MSLGGLIRNGHHRKGMVLLLSAGMLGNLNLWARYLNHAYPAVKPADWDQQLASMITMLHGRGTTIPKP